MAKNLLIIGCLIFILGCKGGNKGPVMATGVASPGQEGVEHTANIENQKIEVNVESEAGTLTISEIIKERDNLNGKRVTVKGEVTKYNPAIMNKNWVHIQDGTEHSGIYDLTITTTSVVGVGEQVVFTGKIVLDRDFGYGYTYSTLMEEAELVK